MSFEILDLIEKAARKVLERWRTTAMVRAQ